jgi:phosphatidylinositol phospholipase C delta
MEDPSRMLRRAGNLLTSNGQPVKELDVDSEVPRLPGSPPPPRHKIGLGASIKRRLQEVVGGSTGRSRSAGGLERSTRAPTPSTDTGKGHVGGSHARSLSDIPIASTPIFDHAKSGPTPSTALAPALSDKRHSAGAQLSSVPEVSILSGEQEVTSPVPEQPTASSSAPQLKDVLVPQLLQQGTPMTKVSAKKHKKFVFRLDADLGQIVWESVSKQQKISEWLLFLFYKTWLGTYQPMSTSSTD